MARNNEPAFRRKTPLLICSIRTEIPYPCIGSSANAFRMSISSVPWTRSLGLSGIKLLPPGYQEEHTLFLLVVKRRRPQNSWPQANSQGIWPKFGAKTESNVVEKTTREAGMGTRPLGLEVLSLCLRPLGMGRLFGVWLLCRLLASVVRFVLGFRQL